MYDIFVSFFGSEYIQNLDPNVVAVLACMLGLFVFHEVLGFIAFAFRRMLGIRT